MAIEELKNKVRELIEKPLAEQDAEIAELVLSRFKMSTTLKVFLYSKRGTTLDECARISRLIGDLMEGTDLFESGYTLEVSSAGLERPLTKMVDFRNRVGEQVKIVFEDKKRKNIAAEIITTGDNTIEFSKDSETFTVSLDDIKQAKIIL